MPRAIRNRFSIADRDNFRFLIATKFRQSLAIVSHLSMVNMEQKLSASIAGLPIGFSVNDTVLASGLCRDMIYSAIRNGNLKARKVGRRTLILRADLEAYLFSLPQLELTGAKVVRGCGTNRHPGRSL